MPDMVSTAMPELIDGGTTFAPGQTVVVSVITFDIPVSGGGLRVNSKLTQLPSNVPGSPITLDGVVMTSTAVPGYVVAGSTLNAGSAVTVDGTTDSLPNSGQGIVINGQTFAAPTQQITTGNQVDVIAPKLISGTAPYIVAGQTFTPGGEIAVDGEVLMIAPGGGIVLVEGAGEAAGKNIAGAIMSVLGVMTKPGDMPATSATSTGVGSVEIQTSSGRGHDNGLIYAVGVVLLAVWLVN